MHIGSAAIAQPRRLSLLPASLCNWLLCWIILPNIAFCAIWVVGGPPRQLEILVTGVVGLLVRKASFPMKLAAFLAALSFSILNFISALFNLSIASLIASIGFLVELRPGASIEYLVLAALILVTLVVAWRFLRRSTDFVAPAQLACAVALIMSMAATDYWMSQGNRGAYKRIAPAGAPFSSAVDQAGFAALADSNHHLLIVIVEAMGLPHDPQLRAKLLQRWQQPDIRARYEVTDGSTTFFGSTTNGEVRELCGRWGDYPDLVGRRDSRCLPARLAAKGYQTTALHSFEGSFFDRTRWYPNIGFQSLWFRDRLVDEGAAGCPGVFPGACDRDVPRIIGNKLKQAKQKQFVYWLTVNTHLPVPVDTALRTDQCARFDPALAGSHPMVCRLFSLWGEVDEGLARLLTDPSLPPTDVLIVGDHAPPFFDREERSQFAPDRVPWILLRSREEPSSSLAGATTSAPSPRS